MQNKTFRFGPTALSATYTTNILNPGTTTGGVPALSLGAWSAVRPYVIGDVVSLAGLNYKCNTGHTNQTPPNAAFWDPVVVGPYDRLVIYLRHIKIVNVTAGVVTFRLFLGATGANAAGTELIGFNKSIPANGVEDWYPAALLRLDTMDFLVGGASAGASLTIEGEGEIGLA